MDNFFARTFQRREQTQKAKSPSSASGQEGKPKGGSFQQNVVNVGGQKAALGVPALARAIQVIADTMLQCDMQYQKYDAEKKQYVIDMSNKGPAIGKWLNYLVQVRPNPRMTWTTLIRQAMHNVYFDGNAYIYVERTESAELRNFWLCTSGSYYRDSDTYNIQYDNLGNRALNYVESSDIIHIRAEYSANNGCTGMNIFQYARTTLNIAATNDHQTLDNAAKGGRMKLLLQEDKQQGFGLGKASKKEMEKVREQTEDSVYQQDVILMPNITSVTPISQNAQDMDLLNMRKFSVKDIARLTGVPAILLMDDSNSNYKTMSDATLELLLRCIAPYIRQFENEFNAKLIGFEGFGALRYHMCTKNLMRLDPKGQAELDKLHFETGWSLNEIREDEELPTIPGAGDKHYVSTNVAELGSDKLKGGNV